MAMARATQSPIGQVFNQDFICSDSEQMKKLSLQ
jgi:hypothetical protein